MLLKKSFLLSLLLVAAIANYANAHPVSGHEANPLPPGYGLEGWEYGPDWNYGDLTFVSRYPDKASLTNEERYMLYGSRQSQLGHPLSAWITIVYSTACAYNSKYGELPKEITPQVYRKLYNMGPNETSDELECLANPITGQYPRLDQSDATPGALYMRALSPDELNHFATLNPTFADVWCTGHGTIGDSYVEKLSAPVIYFRLYGRNGVIANRIWTSWVDTSGRYDKLRP